MLCGARPLPGGGGGGGDGLGNYRHGGEAHDKDSLAQEGVDWSRRCSVLLRKLWECKRIEAKDVLQHST